ncbi:efflux RND transporter permease subunit [Pseudomonas aeruginosa]|uniref:efflux RND transporter permease subunit n=1 Tax=Pseudomonas aeruginosa TaxID=287 RepID=UPI003D295AD4
MFERIIQFAIEQRWLVLLAVLGMAGVGIGSYQKLSIDAVPDITNVQVQINTAAPRLLAAGSGAADHLPGGDRHGRPAGFAGNPFAVAAGDFPR